MFIERFKKLNYDKKCCLVTFEGKYLSKRKLGDYMAFLFALNNFYVELWYEKSRRKIVGVNAFTTSRGLEMYLDKVQITQARQILED